MHGAGEDFQAGVDSRGEGAAFGLKGVQVPGGGELGRGWLGCRVVPDDGYGGREAGGCECRQVEGSIARPCLVPPGIGCCPVRDGEPRGRGGSEFDCLAVAGVQGCERGEELRR